MLVTFSKIIQNNESTRMPWMALFSSITSWGVSAGVETESWCRKENLKTFGWFSLNRFPCRRFRCFDAPQLSVMMSKVMVLSLLFFFSFTRFMWWQFLLVIVKVSALSLILNFAVLLRHNFTSLKLTSSTPEILQVFFGFILKAPTSSFISLTQLFCVRSAVSRRLQRDCTRCSAWSFRFSSIASRSDKSKHKPRFQRSLPASRKRLRWKHAGTNWLLNLFFRICFVVAGLARVWLDWSSFESEFLTEIWIKLWV